MNDERRRRWRANIDLGAGRTQVRPIDEDPRPDSASSQLLDALRRPARQEPSHHEAPVQQSDGAAPALPLNPWEHRSDPNVAQPQDADRRGGLDVRVPAAEAKTSPPADPDRGMTVTLGALENAVNVICERVTRGVLVRVRQMFGLPPEEPAIPVLYGEQRYTVLNPAGAFVTVDPETEYQTAGSFVDNGVEPTSPRPTVSSEPVNPAGAFTAEPA